LKYKNTTPLLLILANAPVGAESIAGRAFVGAEFGVLEDSVVLDGEVVVVVVVVVGFSKVMVVVGAETGDCLVERGMLFWQPIIVKKIRKEIINFTNTSWVFTENQGLNF